MKKVVRPIGTIVRLASIPPVYGVVIDREIWLENAAKENHGEVDCFLRGEKDHGKGAMIPIFFLGDLIEIKLIKVDEELVEESYIQKYGYSNVENTRIITGGVSHLLYIIREIQDFAKGSIAYINSAFYKTKALEMYLNGGYDLSNPGLPVGHKALIRLFEEALPGLAGKESREA